MRIRMLALLAATAGCMNGPLNGTVFDGDGGTTHTQMVNFYGFYTLPNHLIRVQVLRRGDLDPKLDSSWDDLQTVVTGTTPHTYNDTQPMYLWQANVAPGAFGNVRWVAGALSRVRAQAISINTNNGTINIDSYLTAFDDDFNDCLNENPGQSWETIRNNCQTLYGNRDTAALVSSYVKPSSNYTQSSSPQSIYLSEPTFLQPNGFSYYQKAGLTKYPDLKSFKTDFGFGPDGDHPAASEVAVVYYNAGDLGLGREMHCISFPGFALHRQSSACYVTNWADRDGAGNTIFAGGESHVQSALNQAVAGFHNPNGATPIATVAMVDWVAADDPSTDVIDFLVYDKNGALTDKAILDASAHPNTGVPNNCMTCHGGNGGFNGTHPTGAHFLPFDLDSFRYSGQTGFAEADQLDKLRKLNAIVAGTPLTPVAADLLNGWYPPSGPATAPAEFVGDYVPANWSTVSGKKIYNEVIKKYCRTCHAAQSWPQTQFGFDWSREDQWDTNADQIGRKVCGTGTGSPSDPSNHEAKSMPQSLVTQDNFWSSPARAHVVGSLGLLTDCQPTK
jgi:hypothetical protein